MDSKKARRMSRMSGSLGSNLRPGAAPSLGSRALLRGFPVVGRRAWLARLTAVACAVGILTASSWLSVPFYPVPLTFQTLAVFVVGGLMGPVLGSSAVAAWLAIGLAGGPVFHNGTGGPAVFLGPTGGYLVGFLPAAFLMGWAAKRALGRSIVLVEKKRREWRSWAWLAAGVVAASAALYGLGLPWLAVVTGSSAKQALLVGAVPFVLGDTLKAAVAIGAIRLGQKVNLSVGPA